MPDKGRTAIWACSFLSHCHHIRGRAHLLPTFQQGLSRKWVGPLPFSVSQAWKWAGVGLSGVVLSTLVDLPPHILLQVLAILPLQDAGNLVRTCRQFPCQLEHTKAIHAAARAVCHSRKPGRQLPTQCQRLLAGVQCTQSAATWIMAAATDAIDVLMNPDLAEWMMQWAGAVGNWRAVDWVLQLHDHQACSKVRKKYPTLWDRAWLAAVGHAAAGNHPSLLAALMAQPSAPGQPSGLQRLNHAYQARLLFGAISGRDPAAALAGVHPLCLLPARTAQVRPRWPWEEEGPPDPHAVEQQKALYLAAEHAMHRGYKDALVPLTGLGFDLAACADRLLMKALVNDQGATLLTLMQLPDPGGTSGQAVHELRLDTVQNVWNIALEKGKVSCLEAVLDVQPHLFTTRTITSQLFLTYPTEPWALTVMAAILAHLNVPLATLQQNERILASAAADIHGAPALAFVTLLLDRGFPCTESALWAACRDSRSDLLQLLLDRAAAAEAQPAGAAVAAAADGAGAQRLRLNALTVMLEQQATAHEVAAGGILYVRKRATAAGRCAHLLLEYILARCGGEDMYRAYVRYKEGRKETYPRSNCWSVMLGALLVLREHTLVRMVMAMSCLAGLEAKQELLNQAARSCTTTRDRDPGLLLELVRRGARPDSALQAALATCDMRLVRRLLHTFHADHAAVLAAGNDTPAEEPGDLVAAIDLSVYPWPPKAVANVAKVVASTDCPYALEVLDLLIKRHRVAPSAALLLPSGPSYAEWLRATGLTARGYHRLLTWLLTEFGAGKLQLSVEALPGKRRACDAEKVAEMAMTRGEALARWAPLPLVLLCLEHGAEATEVLGGLCQRPQPPLHLINQLLNGQPASLARIPADTASAAPMMSRTLAAPSAPAGGSGGDADAPSPTCAAQAAAQAVPDAEWRGRMLLFAVCGKSAELVDLLLASPNVNRDAALHCKHARPEHILRVVAFCAADVDREALCTLLRGGGEVSGAAARSAVEVAVRLLGAGVDAGDVLLAACKAGCGHVVARMVDAYGADPSLLLEQPVVLAAQHGHAGVVFLLVSRGASLHAALYGAVLGSREPLIKVLLEAGADPAWDEGSAISAAVATGKKALVNLLLPP